VWWVYILRCSDGTFYVGLTRDLTSRVKAHNDGDGSSYTRRRRPVTLVYAEEFDAQEKALARERQLKRWSGQKKQALVARDLTTLKALSRRRKR
jgi:putative endonuclease